VGETCAQCVHACDGHPASSLAPQDADGSCEGRAHGGGQVVDFWAFSTEEGEWGREIMSMHHTRNALQRMTPQVGGSVLWPALHCSGMTCQCVLARLACAPACRFPAGAQLHGSMPLLCGRHRSGRQRLQLSSRTQSLRAEGQCLGRDGPWLSLRSLTSV